MEIFRLLVKAGPDGLVVGRIASKLNMPGATLSFHLSQLKQSGLIRARRDGRRLVQTADFERMTALIGYLTENCCGGAVCAPICDPKTASRRKPKKGKAA